MPIKRKKATAKKTKTKVKPKAKAAATKKRVAKKKAPVRKVTAKKKATPKKKAVAKKRAPAKKKVATSKSKPKAKLKTKVKKKVISKRKVTTKKTAAKKKVVGKKTTPKKTVTKKKSTVKSRTFPKTTKQKKGAQTSMPTQTPTRKQRTSGTTTDTSTRFKDDDQRLMNVAAYEIKSDEDFMNDAQKEHFRGILNQWKEQLIEEARRTRDTMKDDPSNFADPNDRATREEEFSFALRTRDRERKLIRKIDEALARLKNDEFGYCEVCDIPIGVRRLEVRPTATLCIDCKTMAEIKERQIGV